MNSWHAAGIYPVFSNGNSSNCSYSYPPGLNTVGSPARAGDVTGVGATGRSDGLYATYSTWGPTDQPDTVNPSGYPYLKPQVVAPGTNRSAYRTGDIYGDMSGTSMAAPHVSGLIALMWSAAPCLMGDYASTETLIEQTAIPIPYPTGGSPAPGPGNVPNYATGWGEIDALAAIQAALSSCRNSTLSGIVTSAADGSLIASAEITATSTTDSGQTLSDPSGVYTLSLYAGVYTVDASAYGYHTAQTTGVNLLEDQTTTLNFSLSPIITHTVSGEVRDGRTGLPLPALITIDGYDEDNISALPAYSAALFQGQVYTFTVESLVDGYLPATRTVGPLSADQVEDFELLADLNECAAPGYGWDPSRGILQDFEVWPPPGWLIVDNVGSLVWGLESSFDDNNYTGGSGHAATVNSDANPTEPYDTELRSPVFNLSQYDNRTLTYRLNYQDYSDYDQLDLDISIDNGANWINLRQFNTDQGTWYSIPGVQDMVDLSPYNEATQAILRWHYFTNESAPWDWYAQVDEVRLDATCLVPIYISQSYLPIMFK